MAHHVEEDWSGRERGRRAGRKRPIGQPGPRRLMGALLVLTAGTVIASNMGFKLTPNMSSAGLTYTISLPLNHGYTSAQSILDDMAASGCAPTRITKIVPSFGAKGTLSWVPGGGVPGGNFPINTGTTGFDGFEVVSSTPCTTWTIVGTHNPAFVYNFTVPNFAYLVSLLYHTTSINALVLLQDVGPRAVRVHADHSQRRRQGNAELGSGRWHSRRQLPGPDRRGLFRDDLWHGELDAVPLLTL